MLLSIKESGIYWSFKLEVLQKHTFKKSGFSPNLFSRRMSGWWTLKNFSINIMNFVFEIKHKNNAFVQGLDITDLFWNIRKNKNTIIMLNRTGMVLNIH